MSEGGIRVPFIVIGPGISANAISRVRATGMDLLPTMRDLAGAPLAKPENPDARTAVEGGSLVPVLKSKTGEGAIARSHEEIVIHFPHYDLNNGGPASAIYLGDHKLVRNYDTKTVKLYDIRKDPGESNDLAASMPERVKELEAKLDAYLKAVNAQMPTPAPSLSPEADKSATDSKPADTTPPADNQPKKPNGKKRGGGGGGGGGGKNGNGNNN